MLRFLLEFGVCIILGLFPAIAIAQDASPAANPTVSVCAAPMDANAPSASPVPIVKDEAAPAAVAQIPLDRLDAKVSRAEGVEKGDLTLGLTGALARSNSTLLWKVTPPV